MYPINCSFPGFLLKKKKADIMKKIGTANLTGIDIQSYSKRAEITPPSMFTMYFVVVSARHLFALP